MRVLREEAGLRALTERGGVGIALFSSAGCAPCAAVERRLDLWAEAHPEAALVRVPVEAFPRLAAQSGIFASPAVVVWLDGREALRRAGYFSLDELLDRLERYLALRDGEQPPA